MTIIGPSAAAIAAATHVAELTGIMRHLGEQWNEQRARTSEFGDVRGWTPDQYAERELRRLLAVAYEAERASAPRRGDDNTTLSARGIVELFQQACEDGRSALAAGQTKGGAPELLSLGLKPPVGTPERDAITRVTIPLSEYRLLIETYRLAVAAADRILAQ